MAVAPLSSARKFSENPLHASPHASKIYEWRVVLKVLKLGKFMVATFRQTRAQLVNSRLKRPNPCRSRRAHHPIRRRNGGTRPLACSAARPCVIPGRQLLGYPRAGGALLSGSLEARYTEAAVSERRHQIGISSDTLQFIVSSFQGMRCIVIFPS